MKPIGKTSNAFFSKPCFSKLDEYLQFYLADRVQLARAALADMSVTQLDNTFFFDILQL